MFAVGAGAELLLSFVFYLTNSEYKEELREKKFWYGMGYNCCFLVCGVMLLHCF